jgi:hypothetical protein
MSDAKKRADASSTTKAKNNVPAHISLVSGIVAGGCEAIITVSVCTKQLTKAGNATP